MKNEYSKNQVIQLAIRVTTEIGANYPELYQFLDETPVFIYMEDDNEVSRNDFEKYLPTIKHQLRNHIATHKDIFTPSKKSSSL